MTVTADPGNTVAESGFTPPASTTSPSLAAASASDGNPEEAPVGPNKPSRAFWCGYGPAAKQATLGRGKNDTNNAMSGYGNVKCWNNSDPTDQKAVNAVKGTIQTFRVCVYVNQGVPRPNLDVGRCRLTLIPGPDVGVPTTRKFNATKGACITGNRRYTVSVTVRTTGAAVEGNKLDPETYTTNTIYNCNEPGAWRYFARRGRGSASRQLGENITAPICSGSLCDAVPPNGTSDSKRGWAAHHIVPGGEGRNSEGNEKVALTPAA